MHRSGSTGRLARRGWRAQAAGITALMGLVACGGGEVRVDDPNRTTRDTLVVGYQSDIGSLLSVVQESAADSDLLRALSIPLVDTEFDCSLKKQPGWATDWSWSEDGKVLSMNLRDDLKWEDGVPVTVEDLVFTYDLVSDPSVGSPRISNIEHMLPDARPKVISPTHVEWHFAQAYDRDTQMAHASSVSLLPRHRMEDADRATLRGHPMNKNPLSFGPWRLAKYEPNNVIVLEPNPNFEGPDSYKPKLNRVIFRVIPEYSSRLIELEIGKIDMMQGLLVSDADKIAKDYPHINLVRRGWRSNDYIGWNMQNPLFSDKRVRTALAHAVDIDSMIEKLLTSETGEVYARRSVGTITPALCGVHNDDIVPLDHNKEKAKAMLAEAGWADTDGDGILDKDGKPFTFTLLTNTGNKRRADIQILIQAELEKIGVRVQLEKQESNAFFENLRKKRFDAAVAGWSSALFVDPTTLWHCDTEDQKYEFNFVSYCNPEMDALMRTGLRTPDPRDAAPLWKEFQAKLYEDQPYLFLWWMDEIVAVHERFQNTKIDMLSSLNDLHEWEVPPDQVKYMR